MPSPFPGMDPYIERPMHAVQMFSTLILVLSTVSTAWADPDLPYFRLRRMVQEYDVVVFGRLENARQINDREKTDLAILDVIKENPLFRNVRVVILNGQGKPSDVLGFGRIEKGEATDWYLVRATPALAAYVRQMPKLADKKSDEVLKFFFKYLHDDDPAIRVDAVAEFREAPLGTVADVARTLPAAKLRAWLSDPKNDPIHAGVYAFLLSYCGLPKDADDIHASLGKEFSSKSIVGLDGKLVAIISLKPERYVPVVRALAKDKEAPFRNRYSTLNAIRHVHEKRPELQKRVDTVAMVGDFLDSTDMADFAIEDLRRWERWEYTDKILQLFEPRKPAKKVHPSVRRSVLRFALQSPTPSAKAFIVKQRQQDSEWVEETEGLLQLEATPKPAPK